MPYAFRLGRALTGLCLALLVVSCSRTTTTPEVRAGNYVSMLEAGRQAQFQQVQSPVELAFPLDHQAHPQYGLEWWYFTGNLTSDQGHEYGYQLTFFRIGLARADDPRIVLNSTVLSRSEILMAHFAVTNVPRQAYYSQERFGRSAVGLGGVETRNADVFVYLDDWQARINDDGITLAAYAHDDDAVPFAIDLTLSANGPPLLHGQDGFSRKGAGPGQANFYYSLVQLNTQGQLQLGADAVNVTGVSWFDHEWGTSSLPVGGAARPNSSERSVASCRGPMPDIGSGTPSASPASWPDARSWRPAFRSANPTGRCSRDWRPSWAPSTIRPGRLRMWRSNSHCSRMRVSVST